MCGKRTTPPETGNTVPSSAKVRAISRIITIPIAQEMMAAGPAAIAAFIAPNSQPGPDDRADAGEEQTDQAHIASEVALRGPILDLRL